MLVVDSPVVIAWRLTTEAIHYVIPCPEFHPMPRSIGSGGATVGNKHPLPTNGLRCIGATLVAYFSAIYERQGVYAPV